MSKADTVGPAPTFGAVRSARRNAIRSVGGEDATAAVTELPVTVISENPDNPRNHLRNLDEMVDTVREIGVILPIVVATTDAYLRDRADRANDLDDGAHYVVIDGHRRLEAARRVGLATIPVRVDNARVATDEAILEAAFVANYHRDDMTDLEEAHALKQLVDYYGSQSKAAKRLGISQSNISSKLSLLKLAPELQRDLMTGERKVEHVRNLGKLSAEEQRAKADERAAAAQDKAVRPAPEAAGQSAGPADYHGVIIPQSAPRTAPAPAWAKETSPAGPAAATAREQRPAEAIPEPRSTPSPAMPVEDPAGQQTPPKRFPYDDAFSAFQHVALKMRESVLEEFTDLLIEHRAKRTTSTG